MIFETGRCALEGHFKSEYNLNKLQFSPSIESILVVVLVVVHASLGEDAVQVPQVAAGCLNGELTAYVVRYGRHEEQQGKTSHVNKKRVHITVAGTLSDCKWLIRIEVFLLSCPPREQPIEHAVLRRSPHALNVLVYYCNQPIGGAYLFRRIDQRSKDGE